MYILYRAVVYPHFHRTDPLTYVKQSHYVDIHSASITRED